MHFKQIPGDVLHGCCTFGKAMLFSFLQCAPIGYYDPRVNTRVASALPASVADSSDGHDAGYDYGINPATGWPMENNTVDVMGNFYGFEEKRHDW